MVTFDGQTDLAVRALQILANNLGGASLERLALALGTPPDRLLAVVAPLTHAGWVERGQSGPDMFRYTRPKPAPTLHEVVEAVEGSTPIDDCVLRPGVSCAAFQSASVCVAHVEWLRELNASALVAFPLAALLRPTGPGPGPTPGTNLDSRLSAFVQPQGDGREGRAGEPEPPEPFEVAPDLAAVAGEDDRVPAAQVQPC